MRIHRLEAFGFKSFKDKTSVYFDSTITGIVGPNGCGKSNIVDAILWVMGEMSPKYLRGQSMSDVIFMGSENFAPSGYAEVSLFLENDGGPFPPAFAHCSEIVITRRLHRNGDSEYLINNEQARLRDIHEIFMDTGAGAKGFSIIEQGAIGKVITAKPCDRRVLIEEAAGITKFRVRRRESERKLKATEENLTRLCDILSEQKRQLASLEKQSQKAEKYRDIKNELEKKELWLNSKKFLNFKEDLEKIQAELSLLQEEKTKQLASSQEKELQAQALKTQVAEREREVYEKQSEFDRLKVAVVEEEKRAREEEFEIKTADKDESHYTSFLEDFEKRKKLLEEKKNFLEEELRGFLNHDTLTLSFDEKTRSVLGKEKELSEKENSLEYEQNQLISKREERSDFKAKIENQKSHIEEKKRTLFSQEEKLKKYYDEREIWSKKEKRLLEKLEQSKQMYLSISKDLGVYEENVFHIEAQEKELTGKIDLTKENLTRVSGELHGLEKLQNSFEGFQEGVRTLLSSESGTKNFTPLLKALEVDEKYEKALEVALGDYLQTLLVAEESFALEGSHQLKTTKKGRSSFLISNLIRQVDSYEAKQDFQNELGFVGFLSDKVTSSFKKETFHVLSHIVVVDSLTTALRLRETHPEFTFVTLEGESLTREGLLVGGADSGEKQGLIRRTRQIQELGQKKKEIQIQILTLEKQRNLCIQQKKNLEQEKEKLNRLQSDNGLEEVALRKDRENVTESIKDLQTRYSMEEGGLKAEKEKIDSLLEDERVFTESLEKIESELQGLEEKKVSFGEGIRTLKSQLHLEKQDLGEIQAEKSSFDYKKNHKQDELDITCKNLDEINRQWNETQGKLVQSKELRQKTLTSLESRKSELDTLVEKASHAEEILKEIQGSYETMSERYRDLEEEFYQERKSLSGKQEKENHWKLKSEQLHLQLQNLIESTEERYSLDLSEKARTFVAEEFEEVQDEIVKDVESLRKKLVQIGEVNFVAFKEHEDIQKRHEFLDKQYQDLIESKNELARVIEKIDKVCSARFRDSYEKINAKFQEVFPILFGGGKARLNLVENPDNPDEPGIGIEAQPRGKKLQNVSLLSGGEKALTAVSLIFSIFLIKPSPFCLLDEVDAPLDDVNVMRFNELVKEMSRRSQVIMITHNKNTMKTIDKLYGVTMEEKGVSKLVSVKLDAAKKLADLDQPSQIQSETSEASV